MYLPPSYAHPPHPSNCFELLGFDVLLDDSLKPWLLEVNLSPSLNTETALDQTLKTSLLVDLLNLIGVTFDESIPRSKSPFDSIKQSQNSLLIPVPSLQTSHQRKPSAYEKIRLGGIFKSNFIPKQVYQSHIEYEQREENIVKRNVKAVLW